MLCIGCKGFNLAHKFRRLLIWYLKQNYMELAKLQRPLPTNRQRWSQDFGPVVKMDQLVKEVIPNDETKEPFP